MPRMPEYILTLILITALLAGCTPTTQPPAVCTVTLPIQAATTPPPVPTPSPAPVIDPAPTAPSLEANPFPLSEPGSYFVGKTTHKFEQTIRAGLTSITVWYPAIKPEDYTGTILEDAAPDLSAAPYPLILSSTDMANIFAPHLASHGLVAVGVNNQWTYLTWGPQMLDYPRETLYVLDQLATQTLPGL